MNTDRIISLNIGGTIFTTRQSTLAKSQFLANVIGLGALQKVETDSQGNVFIDRSPEYFSIVLNYLRTVILNVNKNVNTEYYDLTDPKMHDLMENLKNRTYGPGVVHFNNTFSPTLINPIRNRIIREQRESFQDYMESISKLIATIETESGYKMVKRYLTEERIVETIFVKQSI